MLHKQYGDEREEGTVDQDEEEEEKDLPEFKEGDLYGLFFSASNKVCVSTLLQLCVLTITYS